MSKKIFGIDTKEFKKIGGGKEGVIYMTPDKKILKVYYYPGRCRSEYRILKQMEDNPYFPKVLECKRGIMLREYVEGTRFREYIKKNGLSRDLALTLIDFAEDFNKLNTITFDGLNKHVFIENDKKIMVIDPVRRKSKLYKPIFQNLTKLGVYDEFIEILKEERPDLASKWLKK